MLKPETTFELTVNANQGKPEGEIRKLTITPATKGKTEYPPLEIPITEDQYNAMRYHFMSAIDDKNTVTKFSFVTETKK